MDTNGHESEVKERSFGPNPDGADWMGQKIHGKSLANGYLHSCKFVSIRG
jgi:hypothetical protein